MIAAGQAYIDATQQARIDATAAWHAAQEAATARARETAQVFEAVDTQLAQTRQVLELRATEDAAQATAYYRTQEVILNANNQQERIAAKEAQIRREDSREAVVLWLSAGAGMLVLFVGFAAVSLASYTVYARIENYRVRTKYFLLPAPSHAASHVIDAESLDMNAQVIDLLERALQATPPTSNIIPRWDKLGFSNPRQRNRVIDRMAKMDLVVVAPNEYTMIRGRTVAQLLEEFRSGQIGIL